MMHDDDCDEGCENDILEARFSPWDLAISFFGFLSGIAQAFGNSADYMLKTSVAASNRSARQIEFAEAVSAELESLPVTTEGEDA